MIFLCLTCYPLCFTEQKTETQRSWVNFPRSHSWKVAITLKSRFHPLLPNQFSICIQIFMFGYKPSGDPAVYICFQWNCLSLGFAKWCGVGRSQREGAQHRHSWLGSSISSPRQWVSAWTPPLLVEKKERIVLAGSILRGAWVWIPGCRFKLCDLVQVTFPLLAFSYPTWQPWLALNETWP